MYLTVISPLCNLSEGYKVKKKNYKIRNVQCNMKTYRANKNTYGHMICLISFHNNYKIYGDQKQFIIQLCSVIYSEPVVLTIIVLEIDIIKNIIRK